MTTHNEPAFPVNSLAEHEYCGMTLRDYFAAKAISGLEVPCDYVGVGETQRSYSAWAEKAYRMADAMLAAR